jgi:ferritin-like protein
MLIKIKEKCPSCKGTGKVKNPIYETISKEYKKWEKRILKKSIKIDVLESLKGDWFKQRGINEFYEVFECTNCHLGYLPEDWIDIKEIKEKLNGLQ